MALGEVVSRQSTSNVMATPWSYGVLPHNRSTLSVDNSHTKEWVHDPVLSYCLLALYFLGEMKTVYFRQITPAGLY